VSDWRRFFDEYASKYDDEEFTRNTEAEIRFLLEQLRVPAGGRILDVGCGTGRHSVGLALAGYRPTGVDLSGGMLEVGRSRAERAGVEVEWIRADAIAYRSDEPFDGAICLCEGAICLLGAADDPFERDLTILGNIFHSLRPGCRLILNVLNACRQIRTYGDDDVEAGRFDLLTLTETTDVDELSELDLSNLRERGYTPPELHRMLTWTGFRVLGIHGGTAGDWGLRLPRLDEMELMAIVERPGVV
jgi:SAM-dependent methyltransferase